MREILALKILAIRDAEDLKKLIDEFSKNLDLMTIKFRQRIDDYATDMSEEDKDNWYELNYDEHWQLANTFPRVLNNSLFVTIHSFFESYLQQLSKLFEFYSPDSKQINAIKSNGIGKYQVYLKNIHGIPFPDTSNEWNRICIFRKIRNFIAHCDSKLDDTNNAHVVKVFAKSNPDLITLSKAGDIRVSHQCNIKFVNDTDIFLRELLDISKEYSSKKESTPCM